MQIRNGRFLKGDCLEQMASLADSSVDMVLCDLPYGTTACAWDAVIPFEPFWQEVWRLLSARSAAVLTGAQPFTAALIMSQANRFKYCWDWDKVRPAGHLVAKKRPMQQTEQVCVFGKGAVNYFPQMERRETPISGKEGKRTEIMGGESTGYSAVYTHKYPTTLRRFNKDRGFHPTQKPVALFEYLIRTYTEPGAVVLDMTAGSGTTAIAAERAGRRWVCIERDEEYYWRAVARVFEGAEL